MNSVSPVNSASPANSASPVKSVSRLRIPRLGLRSRATVAFAFGALLTSILLVSITFYVARGQFVESRKRVAFGQALSNAPQVEAGIRERLLSKSIIDGLSLRGVEGYIIVVADNERDCKPRATELVDGENPATAAGSPCSPFTTEVSSPTSAEQRLRKFVASGRRGSVTTRIGDKPFVITGIDIREDSGDVYAGYYERSPLVDEETNLRRLARAMGLAAVIATIVGALFGRFVSIRVMKPLRQVAGAAREIASGRLDTRIEASSDTDLDPLVGSFNDMAESLQQRLEREARFASDVSHELRTPLTSLSAAVQLLGARRDEMSERSQTALDVLTTQTDYFQQLVLDLLEISRFDAGAAELNMTDFDLVELIKKTAANYDGVEVVNSTLTPATVHLDKRRIERIVVNLLQNAANYGGGAKKITLDRFRLDGKKQVQIRIDDDGPGVEESERTLIFERFRRGAAQRTGSTKGTGLGLALVSEHARLHQGTALVESSPSGGARFVVQLFEGDSDEHLLDRATKDEPARSEVLP